MSKDDTKNGTNRLGFAGFVLSLLACAWLLYWYKAGGHYLGLVLCPIAALTCIIALFWHPRLLAVIGLAASAAACSFVLFIGNVMSDFPVPFE